MKALTRKTVPKIIAMVPVIVLLSVFIDFFLFLDSKLTVNCFRLVVNWRFIKVIKNGEWGY